MNNIVDASTNTEATWATFSAGAPPGIHRLNPKYSGTGFELDDFQKLDEIEKLNQKCGSQKVTRRLISYVITSSLPSFSSAPGT